MWKNTRCWPIYLTYLTDTFDFFPFMFSNSFANSFRYSMFDRYLLQMHKILISKHEVTPIACFFGTKKAQTIEGNNFN